MQFPRAGAGAVKKLSMTTRQSVKKTGISAITGKTVVIGHATKWDMVFIEENLKKRR
jgi:hypothetical protein